MWNPKKLNSESEYRWGRGCYKRMENEAVLVKGYKLLVIRGIKFWGSNVKHVDYS